MENIDVKSFSSFAVTLQKLSQPLVQDGSSTATFNPETLNVTKWQMIDILIAFIMTKDYAKWGRRESMELIDAKCFSNFAVTHCCNH